MADPFARDKNASDDLESELADLAPPILFEDNPEEPLFPEREDPFAVGKSAPPRYIENPNKTSDEYTYSFLSPPPKDVPFGIWVRKSSARNPFIPTFFTFTVGSLITMAYCVVNNKQNAYQLSQRCRILGQALTLSAIFGELAYVEFIEEKEKLTKNEV